MKSCRLSAGRSHRQDGIALIFALLLLIVMSLIGISMMSSTSLDTLMAGGTRESNIAFQAAEAALRDAESRIENATSIAVDFDGATAGLLSLTDTEPDFLDPASWDATSSLAYSASDYPEMPDGGQPRYIIKHIEDIFDAATVRQSISTGGYGQQTGGPVSIFRITARGTSRDGSATAILQSHYGRVFP